MSACKQWLFTNFNAPGKYWNVDFCSTILVCSKNYVTKERKLFLNSGNYKLDRTFDDTLNYYLEHKIGKKSFEVYSMYFKNTYNYMVRKTIIDERQQIKNRCHTTNTLPGLDVGQFKFNLTNIISVLYKK